MMKQPGLLVEGQEYPVRSIDWGPSGRVLMVFVAVGEEENMAVFERLHNGDETFAGWLVDEFVFTEAYDGKEGEGAC